MIDVCIGLTLMYLVLSIVCTAVNQTLAAVLGWRAKNLRAGLNEMLGSGLADQVLAHPRLSHMTRLSGPHGIPWIDREAFSEVLLAIMAPGQTAPTPDALRQRVTTAVGGQKPIPPGLAATLLQVLDDADAKNEAARRRIGDWFDAGMTRLSETYAQKMQLVSLVIGLLVAVAMNADSVAVAKALWRDDVARAQIVEASVKFYQSQPNPVAGAAPVAFDASLASALKTADETLRPLPIGWPELTNSPTGQFLQRLIGWAITGFALMLGAPFWFRILGDLLKLRGLAPKIEPAPAPAPAPTTEPASAPAPAAG
ncbi:MAG: hypothetical protein HQL41_07245 [Alphaproteobacteria bacterium]|nr:hypothetical protein [Alphaproteobacteria bacterium]